MPGGVEYTEDEDGWGPGGNPFASGDLVYDNPATLGRGMSDHGKDDPTQLADKARDVVEEREGSLTSTQAKDLASVVRPYAKQIQEYRKDFVKVRAIFVNLCTAISSFCEKRGFNESAAWFKDLGEAVKRGMSIKALRVARDAGESAKGASAHVSTARPASDPGRSV